MEINEIKEVRLKKLNDLVLKGIPPYVLRFDRTKTIG